MEHQAFFDALAVSGEVSEACAAGRLTRAAADRLRRSDPAFALRWTQALESHAAAFRRVAREGALDGWLEPVVYRGQISYERDPETGEVLRDADGRPRPLLVRRRSEKMLGAMLAAVDPRRFSTPGIASQMKREEDDEAEAKRALQGLSELNAEERAEVEHLLRNRLHMARDAADPVSMPIADAHEFEPPRRLIVDDGDLE